MENNLKINKSSRHSMITGVFGEYLILYWLSKYGYESCRVDHVGIDLISKDTNTNELMGISVKSRSRNTGKEGQFVSIPNDNFVKIDHACKVFNCIPYFAIIVDQAETIHCFLISKANLLKLFPRGETACAWKMNEKWLEKYKEDKRIKYFKFSYSIH